MSDGSEAQQLHTGCTLHNREVQHGLEVRTGGAPKLADQ